VILVVPITHLIRHFRPENAIGIGLFIIPFTALVIALGSLLETITGASIDLGLFSIHPLVLVIIIGIALQGLAECFLSPKFLEYASKQAPKGEVGLYLGYQHLTTFFAWLIGFIAAGLLLDAYCPDPRKLVPETRHEWRLATDPQYRFALDNYLFDDVRANTPVSADLRSAFAEQGVTLPDDARLAKAEDVWNIQSAAQTWTIEKVEHDVRDLPAKLVAMLESENHRKVEVVREGQERGRVIEYVVATDQTRTREEMPALPAEYAHAQRIWYAFAGVGFTAFFALLVFKLVTSAIDRRRARVAQPGP